MSQQAAELASKGVPWRRGVSWKIVGAEGLAMAAIGVYIVAAPDSAQDIVRQIIGWFLLVNACLSIAASLREPGKSSAITPYRMLGAGVGLSVGLLVVLEPVSDYLDKDAARVILALGLLGHGLIGIIGALMTRSSGGLRRGPLITGAISVAFAALLFYNVRNEGLDTRWFGYIALAGGILAMGYAYMLYAQLKAKQTTDAAADAPPTTFADTPASPAINASVMSPTKPKPVAGDLAAPMADADASVPPVVETITAELPDTPVDTTATKS